MFARAGGRVARFKDVARWMECGHMTTRQLCRGTDRATVVICTIVTGLSLLLWVTGDKFGEQGLNERIWVDHDAGS